MTPRSIDSMLREVLELDLGFTKNLITDEAHIVDDLGADSLNLVELQMALEERCGVELDDDQFFAWFEHEHELDPFVEKADDPSPRRGTVAFVVGQLERLGAIPKPTPRGGWL
jgi:acyl carrier protein